MSLSLGAYLAFCEAAHRIPKAAYSTVIAALGVGTLLALLLGRQHGLVPQGGPYWAVALIGYAMFSFGTVAALTSGGTPFLSPAQSVLRIPALRYVGRISYGLYLYHYPILFLFGIAPYRAEATGADPKAILAALAATFLVAAFSFRFIETP